MQEGEDDEDIPTMDTTASTHTTHPQQVSQGPLTRARARQLNYQVNSFLGLYITENRPLPNASDLIVLRNMGKDQGEACGVMDMHGRHNGGHHVTLGPSQARVRVGLVLNSDPDCCDSTKFKRS